MHATPESRDLYFVARGDGHHLFASTYAQHVANIQVARAMQAAFNASRAVRDSLPAATIVGPLPAPADTAHRAR